MKLPRSSQPIWLVCILAGLLPISLSNPTSNENEFFSNNALSAAKDENSQKNNKLSTDSLIPSVRNTWSRSRAKLERLWSKFRSSSSERSNRNLDSSFETPAYLNSHYGNNYEYNRRYPGRTNGLHDRYPPIPQTYNQPPSAPYLQIPGTYSRFNQDPTVPFYQGQTSGPYRQQQPSPYIVTPNPLYTGPRSADPMWYYRNPMEDPNGVQPLSSAVPSAYYNDPSRMFRNTNPML